MKDTKGGGAVKLLLVLIGIIALLAIGLGAYMGLNLSKQRAFVDRAGSACSEAARVDYDFGKVLDSPGYSRDQVLEASLTAGKRIAKLEAELRGVSAGGFAKMQTDLCKALDDHRKLYETIGDETRGGDVEPVRQAVESAWKSYGAVDSKVIPLAGVLPGLAADLLVASLRNMKGAPKVAVQPPKPQPSVQVQPTPPPPPTPAVTAKPVSPAVVATARPAPPEPKPKPKMTQKRQTTPKKAKATKRAKTATYRCTYRGCNAWFVKASLLQRHKKFCIYRPGGPAARARKR